MKRRAESAEETRLRVVKATSELHLERGVAATTMRDIAERADVSPGTVYHHFPQYDDVILACGQYTFGVTRPPTDAIFDGIDDAEARLAVLVRETFSFYKRLPAYERIRAERTQFAPLEMAFSADEDARRALIRKALVPRRLTKSSVAVAFALLDVSVYHRLVRSGLSHKVAVSEVSGLLKERLLAA